MARKEWWNNVQKIWDAEDSYDIEKPVGVLLFFLKTFVLTEFIQLLGWKDKRNLFPAFYAFGVIAVLVILLQLPPSSWSFWLAIYFLASIIVYLLNVVLLSKVFGDILSPERSLIYFILNVAQVVLIFTIFYRSVGVPDALVAALLVFGTVSLPTASLPDEVETARTIAAIQVPNDFTLLAASLAYIIGGLGQTKRSRPSASPPSTA